MPVPLERADRKLVIVALTLLVLLIAATAIIEPPEAAPGPNASSYSAAENGAKAAYLLLSEMGYSIERSEVPLTELPHDSTKLVLVLAEPDNATLGEEDRDSLEEFLRNGGRVLATGPSAARDLPIERKVVPGARDLSPAGTADVSPVAAITQTYPAVAVSPITKGVPEITMAAPVRWVNSRELGLPLYGKEGRDVVVEYPLGQGEVIWWAGSTPLQNSGIARTGNLGLLLNSLAASKDTRILWDEYYHGEHKSLAGYLAGTPVVWALAQVGFVYILMLVGYGRRTGPKRKAVVESRLSPLEFVETLGALYHRAHAASGAVETEWLRFRYLLTRRLALPISATVQQMYDAARERLGWREPGLYDALQRAERASADPSLKDDDALQVVDSLEHYTGLLQLARTGFQERTSWQTR